MIDADEAFDNMRQDQLERACELVCEQFAGANQNPELPPVYATTDGETFETRAEAEGHQYKIERGAI